jgi:hypothetical protein
MPMLDNVLPDPFQSPVPLNFSVFHSFMRIALALIQVDQSDSGILHVSTGRDIGGAWIFELTGAAVAGA